MLCLSPILIYFTIVQAKAEVDVATDGSHCAVQRTGLQRTNREILLPLEGHTTGVRLADTGTLVLAESVVTTVFCTGNGYSRTEEVAFRWNF